MLQKLSSVDLCTVSLKSAEGECRWFSGYFFAAMGSMESMEELRILPQYRLSYREVAYLGLLVFNFEEEQEHEQDFGILPHYRLNDREVAFLDVFLD